MGLNAVQSYPAERVLVAALLGRPASFHELGGRVTEEMFTEPGLRLVFRAFAELASRGEYFSARLMAEYLGYEFLDAAEWVKFRFDGTVDTDATYEALRRDRHARALLDLPRRSWAALLKALLGNPHPAYVATSSGRGVLLRLLLGETLDLLLRDDDLILALALAAPSGGGGESS